ncbi:putative transposase [Escherichia coli 8-415-05_S4_C1]|nr:putative tn3 transposase DDE domain protein [Morganella morganii]KEJ20285.1 putative transposase [Escherichia coli 8-415-05_S4_C1]KEJ24352.1 putative transposase [Escherichia coli 8-415-05_S4_C3]KEN24696.1 putative transposase [Escherichia coli 8-415-05_S3_C3]KEN35553.1 putative transposase [Escherichia coli 8-415-05_S3_C1]KEN79091.1 putative transposase [Escherichia coli 8-415-05_S3_C2]
MPAFEWVHVQLHQQKGMISLSPPTICNSALLLSPGNTSISPENIAGQSLSVGFRPFPQTTPNRKRS